MATAATIVILAKKTPPPPVVAAAVIPKTATQKIYIDSLLHPDIPIVVGTGPAGCGKTYMACHAAMQLLKQKQIQKIIITRPMITVDDEQLGFLPGSIQDKMDPWTRPIFDIMKEIFTPPQIQTMINNEIIEISPLAYMRGRTFNNAYIVADEMQNSSPNQMLMLLTRLGQQSKMAITGDTNQSDRGDKHGLQDLLERIRTFDANANANANTNNKNKGKKFEKIKHVQLTNVDIQRNPIIAEILSMYKIE
jgi:phosphate starvation-inducible PhoH-like protein